VLLTAFEQTRLALCEGNEDAQLVRKLVQTRANIKPFNVSPINDLTDKAKGNGGFGEAIIASEVISGFDRVTEVVIVSDNDDDHAVSFEAICNQIQAAKDSGDVQRDWGVPDAPYVRSQGDPAVTVWMWPADAQQGCLETVLWEIAKRRKQVEADCIEKALRCTGADQWATSKRDKARIRAFMSLVYKKNPALALSNVWRDAPDMFPAQSAEFTPLARLLASVE
jgi:hypothetical protein